MVIKRPKKTFTVEITQDEGRRLLQIVQVIEEIENVMPFELTGTAKRQERFYKPIRELTEKMVNAAANARLWL
jgi:hypothetical protein